jgi:hypothetical protein
MTAFDIILASSSVLSLGVFAFLVLIVFIARKKDRGDLAAPDRNRIDVITRRMTGLGVRRTYDVDGPTWPTTRRTGQ